MAPPTVLASWARTVVAALEAAQLDSAALLSAAGLTREELGTPGARIRAEQMAALWREASVQSPDPSLGLRIARHVRVTTFHALGYSVLASSSLREAVDRVVRYNHLVSEATRLESHPAPDDGLTLSLALLPGYELGGELVVDAAMGLLLRTCRFLAGDGLVPRSVSLARPAPPDASPYVRLFRCPVQFGTASTLELDRTSLDRPLESGDPELARLNDAAVCDYLARVRTPSLPERVRSATASLLESGVTPQRVAKALGLSLRSLQRALSKEGTSYEAELRATRHALALSYLDAGKHPVGEIAFRLGYESLGAFSQAFTRWTGSSPSEYVRTRQRAR